MTNDLKRNDIARVTQMADDITNARCISVGSIDNYVFTAEELLAFEQAVLAKRDTCPIGLDSSPIFCSAGTCKQCMAMRFESLQAKLAMQAEVSHHKPKPDVAIPIETLRRSYKELELLKALVVLQTKTLRDWREDHLSDSQLCDFIDSLSQADVDAFMQGKKAEWEKGVLEEAANTIEIYECNDEMKRKLRAMAKERGGVR